MASRQAALIWLRARGARVALGGLLFVATAGTFSLSWSLRDAGPSPPVPLVVDDLQVSPVFASSPATVTVAGVLRNTGTRPARGIAVGLSASDPGNGRRWIPLQMQPAAMVNQLAVGGTMPFRGVMRLEGVGRFAVGVVALTDEGVLPPKLKPVWLYEPAAAALEVGSVFLTYVAVLGAAAVTIRMLLRSAPTATAPHRRLTAAAIALMLLGPLSVWTARALAIRSIGPGAPTWMWAELPWFGSFLFTIGWLLVGASLRPFGSMLRGLLLGGALYILVGLVWTIGLQMSFGRSLTSILTDGDLLLFGLQWPLQVAQITGLFGLGY